LFFLRCDRNPYAAARPLFEQALAIKKAVLGRDHPSTARGLNNLAVLLDEQGDYAAARPLYEQALAIRKAALGERHPDTATSLDNLAELLEAQGDYAGARPLLEQALAIRRAALGERHPATATSLGNLGYLFYARGDYAGARPLLEQALAIRRAALGERHPATAAGLNNLALLHVAQGDDAAARPLLEQALAIHKAALGPHHPATATSLNSLAELLKARGDLAGARPLYEQALAIRKAALGERHPATADSMNRLALLLDTQGDTAGARPLYEQALAIRKAALGERHPMTAQSWNNVALLRREQGDYATAKSLLEKSLEITRGLFGAGHPSTAAILTNLGGLAAAQGDWAGAEPPLRQALEINDHNLELAAAAQSERQQLAMAGMLRHSLDAYLSATPEPDRSGAAAYADVLSWKGAVLQRQRRIRARRRLLREANDPAVARLVDELEDTTRRLASLALAVPDSARRDAWSRQVVELTARKEHLEAELSRRSARFRAVRKEPTVAQVQAAVPRDAALVDLLEYTHFTPPPEKKGKLLQERRLVAFVLRPDRPVARVELGAAAPIAAAVDHWLAVVARRGPIPGAAADEPGAELRRRVWEPLEKHLEGVATVLVSPDGATARLPIAALPGKEAGTYLIEERALAIIPVPRDLPALLAEPQPPPGSEPKAEGAAPALLLVGDVDFGSAPGAAAPTVASRSAALSRAGAWAGFAPLPATRGEVLAVRDSFERRFRRARADILREDEATEAAFRNEAPAHRYLHLATHGFFAPPGLRSALDPDPAKPGRGPGAIDPFGGQGIVGFHPGLLSGLALAGANRPPQPGQDDGILTALEVAELRLSGVDLVVLSACESGLGRAAGGEGLLGLQRAFQVAGAHAVVAGLWNVGDEPTRVLMERFYEGLWRQRKGRLEALREAQLWMLREGRPRGLVALEPDRPADRSSRLPPFYWAGFVLSGDWR
jgi:CHAT domain-containing protein/tetratricopeptide (TPR) repeat protein